MSLLFRIIAAVGESVVAPTAYPLGCCNIKGTVRVISSDPTCKDSQRDT